MYSLQVATRRWPVAVLCNMLALALINVYILHKVGTEGKGARRLFLSLLAKELCCQFMQQRVMETERNAAAVFAIALLGTTHTTQQQVQEKCHLVYW